MSELILHHYGNSPFSEKIRLILGFKQLPWRSVQIPAIMPKPDVLALTGGYRKTPFMQIGADIYCDSALMARVIDQLQPEPPLYPADQPLAVPLAQWADSTLFWAAVTWAMQPAGAAVMLGSAQPEVLKAFAMDRAAFTAGMRRNSLADATVQLKAHLAALDAQVQRPGPFLFGQQAGIADFAVYHAIWFIRRATPVAGLLDAYPALLSWADRMARFGHHQHLDLASGDAVTLAAASARHAPCAVAPDMGFEAGQAVTISAADYGTDPATGTLVGLNAQEVVIERSDDRAGCVHVHFPRFGFQIKKEVQA